MKSGFDDTGTLAEVVPLAPVRETREAALGLAADCPGWRCWYSPQAGLWFGKRVVERWVPDMTDRAYIVIATNPAMLHAVITTQAVLDLAIEFADWEIKCTPGGHWWATWRGGDDGRLRAIFCEVSAVKLAASLREYVASMDEPDDPRLVWLCDGDDEYPPVRVDQDATLDDVRAEAGNRWSVAAITGGYRAVPCGVRGTPIPRYGRTPSELLESIRYVERQP